MAAIDPTADPEGDSSPPRATLKLIRRPLSEDDDSDDDDDLDSEDMAALLNGHAGGLDTESSEDDSDDEEVNGGPSDPSKTKKARKEAAAKAIMEAIQDEAANDDMEVDGANGKKDKGKGKIVGKEALMDDSEDEDLPDVEKFVLCTLDPVQVS